MVLLALASFLLFFVTYFTGIFTINFFRKFISGDISANFFETFLSGLITSFVYFNLLSFFIPVNYITLLPLLLLSAYIFSIKQIRRNFFSGLQRTSAFFFSKRNLFFTIPFIALLFLYWIVPPLNSDSGEYHYISIRWYEQYKIIPGLGNIHGRLAFNPASFIISAAWSFTDIAGQSLYPLNGVLALLFYTWLVKKILSGKASVNQFVFLVIGLLLSRITLVNISSPSSDLLSGILLFYCGFKTYDLIKENKKNFAAYFLVLLFTCFAVTAKLSAVLSLTILPFIYFFIIKEKRQNSAVIKSLLLTVLIIVPWLVRNFILSGYLLYPVPGSNLFYADWTVPHDVIKLDYIFSKYGPRTITADFVSMQKMNIAQLIKVSYDFLLANFPSSLFITLFSFVSPVFWLCNILIKRKINAAIFILWCIYYFCIWAWLLNSPEHRFGLSYLILAAGIPLLELTQAFFFRWKMSPSIFIVASWLFVLHYSLSVLDKQSMQNISFRNCWLKPAKDLRYQPAQENNYLQTFPFVDIGNDIKLFFPDDKHECLNAPGPCMNWRYGEIEMRGSKIENGFRNKKDEVKKYFPFVDAK